MTKKIKEAKLDEHEMIFKVIIGMNKSMYKKKKYQPLKRRKRSMKKR